MLLYVFHSVLAKKYPKFPRDFILSTTKHGKDCTLIGKADGHQRGKDIYLCWKRNLQVEEPGIIWSDKGTGSSLQTMIIRLKQGLLYCHTITSPG